MNDLADALVWEEERRGGREERRWSGPEQTRPEAPCAEF